MSTSPINNFFSYEPTPLEKWRAIVAFGRNSATYKFAFGKAILNLAAKGITSASTEDLAQPFAEEICSHLLRSGSQITRKSQGFFLDTCVKFNKGEIAKDELLEVTSSKGFVNVIDAFQNLQGLDVSDFYSGNYKEGITFHDNLLRLAHSIDIDNLLAEIEARWRLVESAWQLKIPTHLIQVEFDFAQGSLFLMDKESRRVDLTPARDGLNAYQKGRCFYCNSFISIETSHENVSHIDHFLPWGLQEHVASWNLNAIWNLVLSCSDCNLSKSMKLPHEEFAEKIAVRNDWYCESKHPLSETIRSQTGSNKQKRRKFLGARYYEVAGLLGTNTWEGWKPE